MFIYTIWDIILALMVLIAVVTYGSIIYQNKKYNEKQRKND